MRTGLSCALMLAAAAVAIAPARADDQQEIEALYARLTTALKTKNADATLALEAPDFKAKSPDGKFLDGKQLAAQMKQQNAAVGAVKSVVIEVKDLKVKGKTAVATTSFTWAAEVADPEGHMGPKGKTHVMAMTGTVKNDLVKTAAGWKFKTMESNGGAPTMDGKPMGMAPGGAAPASKPKH